MCLLVDPLLISKNPVTIPQERSILFDYHMDLPCGIVTGLDMKYGYFPVRAPQGG